MINIEYKVAQGALSNLVKIESVQALPKKDLPSEYLMSKEECCWTCYHRDVQRIVYYGKQSRTYLDSGMLEVGAIYTESEFTFAMDIIKKSSENLRKINHSKDVEWGETQTCVL